jgi:predicted chitinase
MSLNEQQNIFMQHAAVLINKAHELGLIVTAGELYRTPEQQKLHVKNGRSKTMNSQHLKRLAIDLNFFVRQEDGRLKLIYEHESIRQLGAFWENLDDANFWGGHWSSFKDTPHFERREIRTIGVSTAIEAPRPRLEAADRGAELLKGTVGFQCDNQKEDVELVQRLLNLNGDQFPLEKRLKCDGIFGSKTLGAIQSFQTAIFGEQSEESKVTPRDQTLMALCRALPTTVDTDFLGLLYLAADEANIEEFVDSINACMNHYEINTPLLQAHFLAQIGHESGELRFRKEIASGRAYEGRRDLGNTEPGDGPLFKGRGLIQLTGRANYTEYQRLNRFGSQVVGDPGMVAADPKLCVDVAGWFWDTRKLNLLAARDDLEQVTRRINGGLNGLEHRRKLMLRAKTMFGIQA